MDFYIVNGTIQKLKLNLNTIPYYVTGNGIKTHITGLDMFSGNISSYEQTLDYIFGGLNIRVMTGSNSSGQYLEKLFTPALLFTADVIPTEYQSNFTKLEKTTISGRYKFRDTYDQINYANIGVNVKFTIKNNNGEIFNGVTISTNAKQNIYYYTSKKNYAHEPIFKYDVPNYNIGFLDENVIDANSLSDINTYYHPFGKGGTTGNWVEIDFGTLPQEVPVFLKNWIDSNLDYVYPYKYTVKSPEGLTLAEHDELPPIRSITLSSVGNYVNMVLTGSNDIDYTLTWSHTVPEGKIFLGLGYAETEKRASIPSGTTTAVTWDSDITVYEIYGKYVPPATTFTITLYQNTAENNRVDKTNYLTSVGSINGTLRSECSILRPSIIIAQDTLPMFNYVYIAVFGRYYFVTGITSVNFGLWRIELNTDVLMSYKEGVKALTAIIARQENDYNDNLIDTEIPTEKEPTVAYQEIPNSVLTTQDDSDTHSFVLTVVGA